MMKSHGCGELRAGNTGERVRLAGWVNAHRDHGGVLFVDLRDSTGLVQVVFEQALAEAHRLRDEWCVYVEGPVRRRPEGTVNDKIPTGEIEVVAEVLEVLSAAQPLPFHIEDDVEVEENTRLRYRYLDIRRGPVQQALRTRAKAVKTIHEYLDERGFVEVETPILFRSTPEGARDFLVPCRLQPGTFYALTQSPQLMKQMLMVGGMERYYQIARCLRDEDLRADRQPEHTQLDLEMSFVDQSDVQTLMEGLVQTIWRECLGEDIGIPFERMTYGAAIDRYGIDRPDLRAGPAIAELSAAFEGTEFQAFASAQAVRGVRIPGAGEASRKELDGLIERAKQLGAKGLVWMVVEPEELRAPIAKFLSAEELKAIRTELEAEPGDLLLLAADEPAEASRVLGALRIELARSSGRIRTSSDPADWRFLWVVDFPLVSWNTDEKRWDAEHHPFTAPNPATEALLETDPGRCVALAYDLVLNGLEVAGGSIRIHRPELQMKAFRALGFTEDEARAKFGFLLDALSFGAPPHGGIAMGVDRLGMILAGGTSIRDAMAFPKTQTGGDPLSGAPTTVPDEQLRESGIRLARPRE